AHATMGRISEGTRSNVLALIDNGLESHEVAKQLGVSHTTVSRVRAQARPHAQKSRGGRPAKLARTDKRWPAHTATPREPGAAAPLTRQLRDITNLECSTQTVHRVMKETKLKATDKMRSRD